MEEGRNWKVIKIGRKEEEIGRRKRLEGGRDWKVEEIGSWIGRRKRFEGRGDW